METSPTTISLTCVSELAIITFVFDVIAPKEDYSHESAIGPADVVSGRRFASWWLSLC